MKTFIAMCVVMLIPGLSIFAQGAVDQHGVYHPTEEEIARNKRLAELLQHPTFITLRLSSSPRDVPRETATDTPAPYKIKDYIGFQLFITQNSSEVMRLGITSPYYEYRPELMRDGELVAYSHKAEELVKRAESQLHSGSVFSITVKPGVENRYDFINLDDWYEPLNPGRYQLILRKQFARGGDWVVSNPVYFEVIPRPAASPIPAGVTMELAPDLSQTKKNGIYEPADDVIVVISVVNNSDQPLKLNVIDREYGNRPQLFRDGKLVSYREEVSQRIAAKEDNPRLVEIINDLILEPTQRWPQGISLRDWYSPLAPGKYRLINRHRFEINGPWTAESAPLLFEVAASKKTQP